MEQRYSVVALSFSEAQPGDTYTCGVSIECEYALGDGSATAPRLRFSWALLGLPHSRLRRQYGAIQDVIAVRMQTWQRWASGQDASRAIART